MCEKDTNAECQCCYCKKLAEKIRIATSKPVKPKFKIDQMVYILNTDAFGYIKNIYITDKKVTYHIKGSYREYTIEETFLLGVEEQEFKIGDIVELEVNDNKWMIISVGRLENSGSRRISHYYRTFEYKLRYIEDPDVVITRYQYDLVKVKSHSVGRKPKECQCHYCRYSLKKSWFTRVISEIFCFPKCPSDNR